jgi:hypothetical protein
MDVILFLLKAITKLAVALTGALVALVTFLFDKLTGHVTSRARQGVPQQAPQPQVHAPQPVPTPVAAAASPAVHVHVHLDQVAGTTPAPPPVTAPAAAPPASYANAAPSSVLPHPDHRIYITTGSHLMMEHPACDDLLERLDEILYRAAFHDGDPFMVAPPLDEARHGRAVALELPPLAEEDETEFINADRQDLPEADGALWVRRAGMAAHPAAPNR